MAVCLKAGDTFSKVSLFPSLLEKTKVNQLRTLCSIDLEMAPEESV